MLMIIIQVNIESPKAFTLYHYNGLQQLSDGGKVMRQTDRQTDRQRAL